MLITLILACAFRVCCWFACLVKKRSDEGLKAPVIWQKSKGRGSQVNYMAVAYGIVYS